MCGTTGSEGGPIWLMVVNARQSPFARSIHTNDEAIVLPIIGRADSKMKNGDRHDEGQA